MARCVTLIVIFSFMFVVSVSVSSEPTHTRSKKSPRVTESVTTTATCREGYVISGSVTASAKDVKIVNRTNTGCDAIGQCTAYQVTAKRPNGKSFELDVSVTCTEDGEDTEYDRHMEKMKKALDAEAVEGVSP